MVSTSFFGAGLGASGEGRLISFFIEFFISWAEKWSKTGFIVGSSWDGAKKTALEDISVASHSIIGLAGSFLQLCRDVFPRLQRLIRESLCFMLFSFEGRKLR
jgi:hypothetical protein